MKQTQSNTSYPKATEYDLNGLLILNKPSTLASQPTPHLEIWLVLMTSHLQLKVLLPTVLARASSLVRLMLLIWMWSSLHQERKLKALSPSPNASTKLMTTVKQVVTTKKARTQQAPEVSKPQAPARRSVRAHATALTAPPKRKRRTKEEIAADKAKAEAEKKQLEELAQQNHRAMVQMDITEDIDRVETTAQTIRTFNDLEDNSGEEFIGYVEVEDSESDDEAEDSLTLKVRFLS